MSTIVELQQLVRALNDSWVQRDYDRLGEFFHQDAVLVAPDFSARLTGRDACVESYRAFVDHATIHDFRVASVDIDLVGDVAVAGVPYEIDYQIASGRWRGTGRDVLVLQRAADRWLVVWRSLIPGPEEAVVAPEITG